MIEQADVLPRAFFTRGHPDIPGHNLTVIVDKVENGMVFFHGIDTNVPSPVSITTFCSSVDYPSQPVFQSHGHR